MRQSRHESIDTNARRADFNHRPPRASANIRRASVLALATLGVCGVQASAQSPINLVLDTGTGTPLPSRVTNNGAPIITVGPANPTATINGVTIRYIGTESVTPRVANPSAGGQTAVGTVGRFVVLGDLNLSAGQRIHGVGPNLIKLEVGNNANFAAGSGIDVSADGQLAGGGGGMGGQVSPSALAGAAMNISTNGTFVFGGIPGVGGGRLDPYTGQVVGPDGQRGRDGPLNSFRLGSTRIDPGTPEYALLFRSTAGGAGGVGQGNAAVAAGGIERAYKRPLLPGQLPDPNDPGVTELNLPVGGVGGAGGVRGGAGVFGEQPGQPGGNGGDGGHGSRGLDGANATPIQSLLNPTVVSLRGGNGGGAGATGGTGLPGAAGGGGGGGGASAVLAGNSRNSGGNGGNGSGGMPGGASGTGGAGGGGGGGIQLIVRGTLNVASNSGFNASGALGAAGQAGGAGQVGLPGEPGEGMSIFSLAGNGGRGGRGGNGGAGGNGGVGIGGSGGVVQVVASHLTFNGSINTAGGFSGDFSTRSADGERFFHAYSGSSVGLNAPFYFGARAAGANPYRSHSSTIVFNGPPGNEFANVPAIEGGAAPYGILAESLPGVISNNIQNTAGSVAPAPQPGHKRVGAVTRVNARWLANLDMTEFFDNDQDLLLYTAFGSDVRRPALSSVDPTHQVIFGDYVPAAPIRLRAGNGYMNDPSINPAAAAPTDLDALPARTTFAMYTSDTQVVTASFSPYGTPRHFTGTPTPAGTSGTPGANTVFLEDRGLAFVGFGASSTYDTAGYEQELQDSGEYAIPAFSTINLRAGDTASVNGAVYGSGHAGTAVYGDVRIRTLKPQGATGEPGPLFTQLVTSYNQIAVDQYWLTDQAQIVTTGLPTGTTSRVGEVIFNPDYDDTTRTIVFPISGRIFGPSPRLQGAGTSDNTFTLPTMDEFFPGATASASFDLLNADVLTSIGPEWRDAIRFSPQLIALSILGYELIDPAGVFSVSGLDLDAMLLNGNQFQTINIGFNPDDVGDYTATLRLLTDLNAPLGQAGDYYTINLSASAVPEPATLSMLVGVGMIALRRPRHCNRAG